MIRKDRKSSRCRSWPVCGSRKWTVKSTQATTRVRPSGLKATDVTAAGNGPKVRIRRPVSTSQIRTVLS